MKVLLDECLPIDYRRYLSSDSHEVITADFAGFKGLKNGKLLAEAEAAGYDVLITVDRGIVRQQNLAERRIAVIVVRPISNQLEDLLPLADVIQKALDGVRPGELIHLPAAYTPQQ